MSSIRVVVCGFESYEGIDVNPSKLVAQSVADEGITLADTTVSVTSVLLPMSFQHAWPTLKKTLDEVQPHLILATGLKRNSRTVALERCAKNIIDASHPDADNAQPRKEPVIEGGPQAYWTCLPLRAISKKFAEHDIPVTFSSDAGTFVCNSLFYELLDWASKQPGAAAGFMSFPQVENHVGYAKPMKLGMMIDAARDVITTSIEYQLHDFSHDMLLPAEAA
ncbi:pyroglutamyl-peptidase I [Alloscardovia venturai]|uniref:Pyrrolidone-carboxylate peptidase n=1 Tax=Alloscardovia venturai TaxID=1769421 RepID=A0ABW2Y233_9BIFI